MQSTICMLQALPWVSIIMVHLRYTKQGARLGPFYLNAERTISNFPNIYVHTYTFNQYSVKNSFDFVEELHLLPSGNLIIVSLHIESLFTNVSIQEIISIINNLVLNSTKKNWNLIEDISLNCSILLSRTLIFV